MDRDGDKNTEYLVGTLHIMNAWTGWLSVRNSSLNLPRELFILDSETWSNIDTKLRQGVHYRINMLISMRGFKERQMNQA